MKLPLLHGNADADAPPWYADGLNFTCTQCGNCCTGGPGYVWISKVEIARLAAHLKITPAETVKRYCRKIGGRISLNERLTPSGNYDCVFLVERPGEPCASGTELQPGQAVPLKRRGCSIYPVRPLQCRTWPFWDGLLASRENWDRAAKGCHGMNAGHRHFGRERIEELRDAADWPESPPTSNTP